ncbi:IS30 family transposase, partial [Lactobacillus reuteri]|nr:IS30 family transposase [Limosilactobacillus reuteri]
MTYTHLTTNELTIIAHSFVQKLKAYRVAQMINCCAETVYRVYRYLETGASIADYQDHYMRNKQRCGRKRTQLSLAELTYINDKIAQGWT